MDSTSSKAPFSTTMWDNIFGVFSKHRRFANARTLVLPCFGKAFLPFFLVRLSDSSRSCEIAGFFRFYLPRPVSNDIVPVMYRPAGK